MTLALDAFKVWMQGPIAAIWTRDERRPGVAFSGDHAYVATVLEHGAAEGALHAAWRAGYTAGFREGIGLDPITGARVRQ